MRLLFDENLSPRSSAALGALFPGSAHVRECGLLGAPDEEVWAFARKHKGVGIVLGSWTLLTNGPKAAAAEFFEITPAGVDALLEGQARIDLDIWDPEGSVDIAELASGDVIHEGDEFWYAWRDPAEPKLIGRVDHGEVDYIVPTEIPGVVDVFVRFGQERREYRISFLREMNPIEGDPWPVDTQ